MPNSDEADFIQTRYGYCYFDHEQDKNPMIYGLVVHPRFRGRGLARRLLGLVANEIRASGWLGDIEVVVRSESNVPDAVLEQMYRNVGLVVVQGTDTESNSVSRLT